MAGLRSLCAVFVALGFLTAVAAAQELDEDNPYRPGLVATYTSGNATASRVDEVLAFDWQQASPDPRLAPGPFAATWRGRLLTQSQGSHRLACYVQGNVELKLGGRVVLSGQANQPQWIASEPMELPFDRHEIEVTFRQTGTEARLALFWSGPDFRLEPVPERFLMHDRQASPSSAFERGRQLASALRCAACHQQAGAIAMHAPSLDRLTGNIEEPWLADWLSGHGGGGEGKNAATPHWRRMPDLAMTREEAQAVAAWLLREPAVKVEQKAVEQKEAKGAKEEKKVNQKKAKKGKGDGKGDDEKPKPSAEEGERLILTRGCLACHQLGDFGESGLFGGGDLTNLAAKRSSDFLVRWLENPKAINRQHRMPEFSFTRDEFRSLELWGQQQRAHVGALSQKSDGQRQQRIAQGEKLVVTFRCANCHVLARDKDELALAAQKPLNAASDWPKSCIGLPDRAKLRPGYQLAADDHAALKEFYSQARPGKRVTSAQARGKDLLIRHNCLSCHQREGIDRSVAGTRSVPATLADKLTAVAETNDSLAPLVPAMTPPALNSVGDKLHDVALADSIRRKGDPHRPYLLVQMPKFDLSDAQLADITAYFIATDRLSSGAGFQPAKTLPADETSAPRLAALAAAGPRLVTADGLACTSCHQVGTVQPAKAPLNARGPDLSMLDKRIRREWYDRWCDNPARIVPRMEMPAVKVPVRGVLNDKVEDQLASVWHILNTPGFEPPEPNPVRVLRLSGVPERNERPIVIHDVFKDGDKTYLYPLVIGLPNRHNILFDLETNRLAAWWLGDTARQRTRGKSWFWEMGGSPIFEPTFDEPNLAIWLDGKMRFPQAVGQFTGKLELAVGSRHRATVEIPADVSFLTKLQFPTSGTHIAEGGSFVAAEVSERFRVHESKNDFGDGFTHETYILGKGGDISEARLRLVNEEMGKQCNWIESSRTLVFPGKNGVSLRILYPRRTVWNGDGTVSVREGGSGGDWLFEGIRRRAPEERHNTTWTVRFLIDYRTTLPVDQYFAQSPPEIPVEPISVEVSPGFIAKRLPLADDIMPSAFTWKSANELVVATLKGEVLRATDSNGDSIEDTLQPIADGIATPYGIQTGSTVGLFNQNIEYVDVAAKDGLLRLQIDPDGSANWIQTMVSGWGYTDDYHDWAVGLIRDERGAYYAALPCQQDQRSEAAAKFRGKVLKLVPRTPSLDDPREFDLEVISAGHRFPMGMAMNRDGELFVTDNQGNYNPFNELNHVRKGAHFGFINALEKEKGFQPPPLTEPAINIPHPWTRSVNGICFLDTPAPLAGTKPGPGAPGASLLPAKSIYGPLEGHLVGCEYDTRRLIRMSLQKVGDTYQGCAYPLSIPPADVEKGLLGPIVCAIKPTTGELYVGEIRDSGWGASNNIGQIVKIKIEPEKLPCGIAEVRATAKGFTIDFFQPVDRAEAADAASYSISSYRRESTPAYGGPDLDRREEKIAIAEVSADGKRVALALSELRTGHVYEIKLRNLAPGGAMFHPDEAHYTLRQIPQ